MDSVWQTLALGAVQGAAEFLPVSSSGHLALLQTFFGMSSDGLLAFDLLLHCATALAVLIFFREDATAFLGQWCKGLFSGETRASEGWRYGWLTLAGTAMTALVALPLKGAVEAAMASPLMVGCGFLTTAGLLCLAPLAQERRGLTLAAALVVGLAQGLAVFPGVSRSGATIAAALFMGLPAAEAFRFSFLMSVPAILGASLLEGLEFPRAPLPMGWPWAALLAFALGCCSLSLLRRLVLSGRWAYFGLYCFLLGLVAVVSGIMTAF
ncbi:MAG: undecaprenyl-diphosphate phosphatase [Synergistaceae bacterium]|jgi:undecaprenyl-diphosphatase|nr:undecaprenyl-diphosphate phosphatase [Synergistaceae bacterium]